MNKEMIYELLYYFQSKYISITIELSDIDLHYFQSENDQLGEEMIFDNHSYQLRRSELNDDIDQIFIFTIDQFISFLESNIHHNNKISIKMRLINEESIMMVIEL